MALALVNFFLYRIEFLLHVETDAIAGFEDQMKSLMNMLREIGAFVGDIGSTDMNELRVLINDMDYLIDEFILQRDERNESNRTVSTDCFRNELQKLVSCLAETLHRMKEFHTPTALQEENEQVKENSDQMDAGETSASNSSVKLNFMNLPYYLQSCLKYCCIFPEGYLIHKGRLIRLLVAEGIIQGKAGAIMEDIAEENINELISLEMLQVADEHPGNGTKLDVPSPYREFLLCKMNEENSDTSIPHVIHRVSIYSDVGTAAPNLNNQRPRSFILFKNPDPSEEKGSWLNFDGAKFLRVLDLEGSKIKNLPDEVGDLIHLRYLGLKHTDISELPDRLGMLRALQTLDIRWCGNLTELPDGVLNLVRLRHLKMFKNLCVGGMKVPEGIARLKDLLTLTGIYAGGSIARELANLHKLRTLGVMDVAEEHTSELHSSIMKMQDLLSLSLEAKHTFDQGTLALSETFSPPPLVKKLRLEGVLESIPSWLGSMRNLTKIRLGFSHLSENPCLVFQCLPNLKQLTLWQAFDAKKIGKEFCKVGGFPKLEVLSIASRVLEEWTELEEGALPNLKYLHLHNCLKLRMLPEGLQFVTTLKQLDLLPVLYEHKERLKPDGGEENHKIKHIPRVSFITMPTLRNSQVLE